MKAATDESLWLTEEELAKVLKCSTKKLYNDRKAGKLPYRKQGRLLRYFLPDVVREYGVTPGHTATRGDDGKSL